MTAKSRVEQQINGAFRPLKLQLRQGSNHDMYDALKTCQTLGLEVNSFIDVGASDGKWTEDAAMVYRNAHFLMIEALSEHRPELDRLIARDPARLNYTIAAAGEKQGTISFSVNQDLDSSGVSNHADGVQTVLREVPVTTIDTEVERLGLTPPFCLKLDTHGHELPILAGAAKSLDQTSLVIMEVYNFEVGQHPQFFWQMCAWMDSHGFRVADLVSPVVRPSDGLFWQCDLFFARKDWPPFKSNSYA